MYKTVLFIAFLLFFSKLAAQELILNSPDEKITVKVLTEENLSYQIRWKEKTLLNSSEISLELEKGTFPGKKPKVVNTKQKSVNQFINPPYGMNSEITGQYNELRIDFENNFSVIFRAYNEGVAYRIVPSFKEDIIVNNELVEYNFETNPTVYFPKVKSFFNAYDDNYKPVKFEDIKPGDMANMPVLIKQDLLPFMLISEADQWDYPGMFIEKSDNKSFKVIFPKYPIKEKEELLGRLKLTKIAWLSELKVKETANFIAQTKGNRNFPWRVIIIAEKDKDLMNNELIYKLASPNKLEDTDWIKPGKVAWDWYNHLELTGVDFKPGINTRTYKYFIDFAAKNKIEYINLDEGWTDNRDLLKLNKEVDVHELIRYGKERNVGVWLWMMWNTLDQDMEMYLDTFANWGAAGLKIDFFDRDDQKIAAFVEKIASESAKRKLLVNLHGIAKPTGQERTYPNIITREAILGLEHNKFGHGCTPTHNVTLPFTRFALGAADYTPGAMFHVQEEDFHWKFKHPKSMTTRCQQLAMYVVYYSPLQMLSEAPTAYEAEPDILKYLSKVPVNWDKTVNIDGKIAEFAVVARKKDKNWYVGGMFNKAESYKLKFDFLEDKEYTATIYRDTKDSFEHLEKYEIVEEIVNNKTELRIEVATAGGFAMIISPK
ncbi:MAG: glycoside hydrolase family 97 protein [Bacteroidetes bacterium]|nr:MAG: glycoside hydrolase family 97 protein [Bacteroidota bacterium]